MRPRGLVLLLACGTETTGTDCPDGFVDAGGGSCEAVEETAVTGDGVGGGFDAPTTPPETTDTLTDTAIGGMVPSDAPVLRNCDAFCRLNDSAPGYAFFQWTVECIYEDPQGDDTVLAFGDLSVAQNGATWSTQPILCSADNGPPPVLRSIRGGHGGGVLPERSRVLYLHRDGVRHRRQVGHRECSRPG